MSNEELYEIILQTSKSELMILLQEISSAKSNELDNAIQRINKIINLME